MEAASVSLCALRCGNRHSDSIAKLILIDQRLFPKGLAFGRLEPYEVKFSRMVLRGLGPAMAPVTRQGRKSLWDMKMVVLEKLVD